MSITTALKARRETLRNREDGFTLIELLVVVIIIGILAAIAIPIYIGVQNNAKDKAAQSDLTNARTAIVAYYSDKGSFPDSTLWNSSQTETAGLGKWGFPAASGTNASAAVTSAKTSPTIDNFCLKSTSDSNEVWYLNQAGTPKKAADKPSNCS